MAKKITKSAQQLLEDTKEYYNYLLQKTKEMEKELAIAQSKINDDKMKQKDRRDILDKLSKIKANHFRLDALEVVLFK